MSTFSDLRQQLADDLVSVEATIYPSWPVEISPPCAFVTPPLTEDYIRRGPNFGEYTVSLDLVLLVPHADGPVGLAALETLLQAALANVEDWALSGVDTPGPVRVIEDGPEYLATVIHLSKPVGM